MHLYRLVPALVCTTALFGEWAASAAQPLATFDFTQPEVVRSWHPDRHIRSLTHSPEGMRIVIDGFDPYCSGPAGNLPADTPVWVQLRLKSEAGGSGQLFYYRDHPTEENSMRFPVPPGDWRDVRVKLPPLGPGYRFRLDPPGTEGVCVLASLAVSAAVPFRAAPWPAPAFTPTQSSDPTLLSGNLRLTQSRKALGAFVLEVAGEAFAVGHDRQQVAYVQGDRLHWFTLAPSNTASLHIAQQERSIVAQAQYTDAHGDRWELTHRFTPGTQPDTLDIQSTARTTAEKSVVFFPLLTVLPGAGTFGTNKHQALFAGLEYLANEPSSSEADLRGPAANRLVPDTLKITFPLMALQHGDRYLGLAWEINDRVSALFDSPDRIFQGGAHALALIAPGSDGLNREDGHLLPHDGLRLLPGETLTVRATLLGGRGSSIVPALQQYVALRGLPPLPRTLPLPEYARLAAAGWLDSAAREQNQYRHAVWPGFGPQPAADAACYQDWLAPHVDDNALAKRLATAAREALPPVDPQHYFASGVGHVRYPMVPLVEGKVLETIERARQIARHLLTRFEPDGRILYRRSPDRPDYGATHFAPDANGLTAQVVASLLEAAAFAGDSNLIGEGLQRLRALDAFRNTVPRGAQTWECPLHTPDILAAAHLVRAYTLGFELTGDASLLETARYWAWTGLPFIYLRNPTPHPLGPYLTPPVYGATAFVAPVWMGLPVQWCGLVYADALYRFHRHDPARVWQQLADGITIGGVQVTWPTADAQRPGLLPDVFHLREQHRDGPAINPGTLQACAARYYTGVPLYDFVTLRPLNCRIHAPGRIEVLEASTNHARIRVTGWPAKPYAILINGLLQPPRVRIDGVAATLGAPHHYSDGSLVLQARQTTEILLETSP